MRTAAGEPSSLLTVSLGGSDDPADLERNWRALDASDQASFFQGWNWLGSLLESLPSKDRPSVIRVRAGEEVVGLGLLSLSTERRRLVVRSRVLHLNETGRPDYDRLTMEHNGMAAAPGCERAVREAVLDYLIARDDWDELRLDGFAADTFQCWADAARARGLRAVAAWSRPFYRVDLDRIRGEGQDYLRSLSANTRQQIRRSLKGLAAEPSLHHAASCGEAHAWLQHLMDMHQAHWQAKGLPGAFATEHSRCFHAALVSRAWPSGGVEITTVRAGAAVIGHLYNFRKGRTLYNYQSAFLYGDDPKVKPGLVCHALAAQDALDRGLGVYDLLAGGGRYKQSLTNAEGTMVWGVLQRKRLMLGLEHALKMAWRRWRAAGADAPA